MDIRISTITAISNIKSPIDLSKLYEKCPINNIIQFIEFGEKTKGISNKKIKKRNNQKKKTFFNQLTIQLYIYKLSNNKLDDKIINIKVFNNGKLQLTGLKYEEQGTIAIQILLDILIPLNNNNDIFLEDDISIQSYKLVLINSDFDMKFAIDRDKLNNLIIEEGYYSTYEACMYPGVNIKYYINLNNNNGICKCNRICNGKGDGKTDGDCKKITIAVFKSGKIIITGGQNRDQIKIAYHFISNFINKYKDQINLSPQLPTP